MVIRSAKWLRFKIRKYKYERDKRNMRWWRKHTQFSFVGGYIKHIRYSITFMWKTCNAENTFISDKRLRIRIHTRILTRCAANQPTTIHWKSLKMNYMSHNITRTFSTNETRNTETMKCISLELFNKFCIYTQCTFLFYFQRTKPKTNLS